MPSSIMHQLCLFDKSMVGNPARLHPVYACSFILIEISDTLKVRLASRRPASQHQHTCLSQRSNQLGGSVASKHCSLGPAQQPIFQVAAQPAHCVPWHVGPVACDSPPALLSCPRPQDGGRGPVWHMKRAVWVGTLIITVF